MAPVGKVILPLWIIEVHLLLTRSNFLAGSIALGIPPHADAIDIVVPRIMVAVKEGETFRLRLLLWDLVVHEIAILLGECLCIVVGIVFALVVPLQGSAAVTSSKSVDGIQAFGLH